MFSIGSCSSDFPQRSGKRFKVIINQGGGIFGYIITNFMSYLDFDLYKKVDVVAGTSIGGILSMAYSVNSNYMWLNKLFNLASKKIFDNKKSVLFNTFKYDNASLKKFLKEVFKDKKLSDLSNHVLITTTDFTLALPRIFENINLKPEQDISLVDLGLMTSAAPTFFKSQKYKWQMMNHDIDDTNICERVTLMREFQEDKTEKDPETNHASVIMDGGLLENIPIISTYTTLKTEYGVHPEDIDMFVIGAGDLATEKNHTLDEVNSWSVFDTLKNLIIPYITDSNEMTSLYWGLQMGFNSFRYYNPIKISGSMDNLAIMPDIEKQCLEHKQEFIDEINKFINA